MSYTFKVGDKGKLRNGLEYEIVLVVPETAVAEYADTLVALVSGHLSTRQRNGSYYNDGTADQVDLLAPSRTVYINIYDGGGAFHYKTEDEARKRSDGGCLAVAVKVELPSS